MSSNLADRSRFLCFLNLQPREAFSTNQIFLVCRVHCLEPRSVFKYFECTLNMFAHSFTSWFDCPRLSRTQPPPTRTRRSWQKATLAKFEVFWKKNWFLDFRWTKWASRETWAWNRYVRYVMSCYFILMYAMLCRAMLQYLFPDIKIWFVCQSGEPCSCKPLGLPHGRCFEPFWIRRQCLPLFVQPWTLHSGTLQKLWTLVTGKVRWNVFGPPNGP